MLVRLFRQNQPLALIGQIPMVLLLWPGGGSGEVDLNLPADQGMPFFWAFTALCSLSSWAGSVAGFILLAGLVMQLNYTTNESDLFGRRNHLPALLLPLLLALFPMGMVADPAMLGAPFVLWAVRRLWASQGDQRVLGPLFDAGLLIGLAAMCYLPYLFLVVVIWSSISVMRPFHWREYMMPLLGALVVLSIARCVIYLLAPSAWDPVGSLVMPVAGAALLPSPHWLWPILLVLVFLGFVVSAVPAFAAGYSRGVMREKNTRASLLAFSFAFGLLAAFAWFAQRHLPSVFIGVPLAIFFSYPLLVAKRMTLAETGVIGLLALGLWARWG
ncbi:MAG: hypothetical protein IPO90_08870 [Flavobacteriales bacterium]|nr:hypothetical protein [Flavobacteriales bacterium]